MADLLEHEPRRSRPGRIVDDLLDDRDAAPPRLPSAGSLLAAACAATLVTGTVAVARHEPPPAPAPVAAEAPAPAPAVAEEPWTGPRRVPAALLPPGRPRRNSPSQIGVQRPEVPRLGTVGTAPRPGVVAATEAAYAMVGRLCRDPSLVRLRRLQHAPDYSAVTYYARVYEDPPSYGGFAIALRWTGSSYAYTVTGKAGDCRDRGTG